MDIPADRTFHDALAAELRDAQAAARLSAPKLEALTGIVRDSIRRTVKGDRALTVVELFRYAAALGFETQDFLDRALARAQAQSGRGDANGSRRLGEKLSLLATSAGLTIGTIYADVESHMTAKGFRFSRKAWEELFTDPRSARREVLFAIADALEVDPRYLTGDDPSVDLEVEARLRFHRAMADLGVTEVSARMLDEVDAEELEEIQQSITRAIKEHRKPD